MTLRPTLARAAGAVWLATGGVLVIGALLQLWQTRTLGWEVPAGLAALAVGWWCWQRTLAVDELGIEQQVGWRRARLLWSVVGAVEIGDGRLDPVRVRLAGRDEPVDLAASWGTTRRQRADLRTALRHAADRFDVEVREG